MKSKPNLSFSSFLFIFVVITGAIFIGWFSIVIFSEGKIETPDVKITSPNNGQNSSIGSSTHVNNTSNSTSSNIKKHNDKVATSERNLSGKLTKSLSAYNYNYDNNAKPLSISIQSSQDIVNGRGTSTITAIAYDATTGKKIDNAVVKLKITFTSNDTSKKIVGHNGEVTYSAETNPNSKDNNISFRTTVQAFAPGYISSSKTSSSSTSIITDNSGRQESIINNNATSNLAQNIVKNIQRKLEQNGIDFSLGK